jgi:hypothetical protein
MRWAPVIRRIAVRKRRSLLSKFLNMTFSSQSQGDDDVWHFSHVRVPPVTPSRRWLEHPTPFQMTPGHMGCASMRTSCCASVSQSTLTGGYSVNTYQGPSSCMLGWSAANRHLRVKKTVLLTNSVRQHVADMPAPLGHHNVGAIGCPAPTTDIVQLLDLL